MFQAQDSTLRSEANDRVRRRSLDLSDRGLTYLNPTATLITRNIAIAEIRRLTLVDNALSVIPNTISQFVSLEELDVSRNSISWLSGEIARLPKLKILIARNNRLRTLPKELESSPSLEILNLSGNLFTGIPREILGLRKLKELYLGGNYIGIIAEDINRLEGYEFFYSNYFQFNKL